MNKKILKTSLYTLLIGVVLYYFILPPLNLSSIEFYNFIFIIVMIFMGLYILPSKSLLRGKNINDDIIKPVKIVGTVFVVGIILIILINGVLSPIFNSKSYASRITVNEDATFTSDVKPVDFNNIPLLDKDSSQKLGDRVMGQLSDLVSQFYVSDLYTQINYKDSIVRVTPLEYNGFIKYLTNHKDGVAGYITVNSVNGEANLTKLDNGMKYVPSAYFFENLNRKLRLTYPTAIIGDISFEIDNDGNPYWIVPTLKYSGVGLKKEVNSVIIMSPITGESTRYNVDDVPTWVDHVYSADLIVEQLNDWGSYRGGFLNSIFGQKNVVATTKGYNYLTNGDDVYLYTGITSVLADESNIGFVLTNMRTKETKFYAVPGAEEYSAMASAEGQVQQMSYTATFPLLINLNNKPTYLISLKDNAGLVKMYAFVDVADYQKVVATDASKGISEAAKLYSNSLGSTSDDIKTSKIKINTITSAIIGGNTYYYLTDTDNNKYRVSISVDEYNLPFIVSGTTIEVTYTDSSVREITSINK